MDSAWEQEEGSKPRVHEMLDAKRAARRKAAVPSVHSACCVGRFLLISEHRVLLGVKVIHKHARS